MLGLGVGELHVPSAQKIAAVEAQWEAQSTALLQEVVPINGNK